MGMYGDVWSCIGMYGHNGLVWVFMFMNGFVWEYTVIYGLILVYMLMFMHGLLSYVCFVWSCIVQYGESVCSHTNLFDLRSYARYLVVFT